jgi:purine-nucleoside phosphorylase
LQEFCYKSLGEAVLSSIVEIKEAAEYVQKKLCIPKRPLPKVAVVLGSGLSRFADNLIQSNGSVKLSFQEIPHFCPSTVDGHKGELIYGFIDHDRPVVALSGRLHLYEGFWPQQVILPIRVLGLLGISTLILTNACGAIDSHFEPGQLMVVTDHLNLTGSSPLVGANISALGPRFVDMSDAYDPDLIKIAKRAASYADIKMHEGIYAGVLGPCYETPAEIRMLRIMGAHAVGMSTVFETIAARHMELKVLAISCLTNIAAGLSAKKICHEEVLENNAKMAHQLELVLTHIVKEISKEAKSP